MNKEELQKVIGIFRKSDLIYNKVSGNHRKTNNKIADLLEKRVPKRVGNMGNGHYCCPDCGYEDNLYDGNTKLANYCPNCGQALDWTEENVYWEHI